MITGYFKSAAPYFLTDDPPPGVNPLLASLTSDVPAQVRGTDPVSAAVVGFKDWYGAPAPANAGGLTISETPWYTRVGVIVLAVLLIGLGVWTVIK